MPHVYKKYDSVLIYQNTLADRKQQSAMIGIVQQNDLAYKSSNINVNGKYASSKLMTPN